MAPCIQGTRRESSFQVGVRAGWREPILLQTFRKGGVSSCDLPCASADGLSGVKWPASLLSIGQLATSRVVGAAALQLTAGCTEA
jgi:hypothetical protein